jgi:hypothetical protein
VKQKILWIVVIDQCGATLVDTMATVNLGSATFFL